MCPGMTVCLKSGGPTMTIEEIKPGTAGKAVCVWFHSTFPDLLQREEFPLHALREVKPGGGE